MPVASAKMPVVSAEMPVVSAEMPVVSAEMPVMASVKMPVDHAHMGPCLDGTMPIWDHAQMGGTTMDYWCI